MKNKIAILILAVAVPLACMAEKDPCKRFNELIKKYDVWSVVDTVDRSDPANFWRAVQRHNKPYQKALKAAKEGKARNAQNVIGGVVQEMRDFNNIVPVDDSLTPFADSLMMWSGIKDMYGEANLCFTLSTDKNSYAYPDGAMYIPLGFVESVGGDADVIKGMFAHELSHFVLQHLFVQTYMTDKQSNKSFWYGVLTTVGVAAFQGAVDGVLSATMNYQPSELDDYRDSEIAVAAGNEAAAKRTTTYYFNYGRDQEYESDIIAYRFLQWMGIDPQAYITAIEALYSELEIFQNSGEARPYVSDRIALLKYMHGDDYQNWLKVLASKK